MDLSELVTRERVRDTYARYTHAGDRFLLDDLAACFTPDGVLEIAGASTVTGRSAIRELLGGGGRPQETRVAPRSVRHFVSNLQFTSVGAAQVEASAYFQVLVESDAHSGLDHWGRYRDVLAPVGDEWLFAHRTVRVDFAVPGGWYAARR